MSGYGEHGTGLCSPTSFPFAKDSLIGNISPTGTGLQEDPKVSARGRHIPGPHGQWEESWGLSPTLFTAWVAPVPSLRMVKAAPVSLASEGSRPLNREGQVTTLFCQ